MASRGLLLLLNGYSIYLVRFHKIKYNIELIKCNDTNKNSILPPNNVVPPQQLWLEQSSCQATHKVNKGVGLFVV